MKTNFTLKVLIIVICILLDSNLYSQGVPPIKLNIETAGSLSKLVGDKFKDIRELTLTGDINASDIHVIRNMENLVLLDLKAVNIKKGGKFSYSYNAGTPDTGYYMHTEYRETKDNIIPSEMLYRAKCKKLETLILPHSVNKIDFKAFYNYENTLSHLTTIVLNDNIIEISSGAFSNLDNLKSITLPNNLLNLYQGTFSGCTSLTSIIIPNSVTKIGGSSGSFVATGAFNNCTNLESITIPSSVAEIDDSTFGSCTNLKSINVSEQNSNYMSLDGVLFTKNKNKLVAYPNSKGSFYRIPDEVSFIEKYAFYKCFNLKHIHLNHSTPPSANKYSFFEMSRFCTLHVPKGSYNLYWISEGWREFNNIIEEGSTTSSIDVKPEIFNICNIDGGMSIESEKKSAISIYTITGLLVRKITMQGKQEIELPKGIYVVNTNSFSQKVIIN